MPSLFGFKVGEDRPSFYGMKPFSLDELVFRLRLLSACEPVFIYKQVRSIGDIRFLLSFIRFLLLLLPNIILPSPMLSGLFLDTCDPYGDILLSDVGEIR